jgi:Rps23 Pro-64 3,4-dihydroxylase Tpa1-like proline 4-hydroxylase
MPLLTLTDLNGFLVFDAEQCRIAGRDLRAQYERAVPFPHIVLDDFLDRDVLRQIASEFPDTRGRFFFNREQERLKYQFRPEECTSALARNILSELNGEAFLGFLEELTGVDGLVSDPYYDGGGLHEIRSGGHLSIHADFNMHQRIKLERRLNLLIYLNEDWSSSYGGDLELWSRDMQTCDAKIAPVLGRAVVFSTNRDSFHGHPEPLTCPQDRARRSIATYYYTAFADGYLGKEVRNTVFQVRPGSKDVEDRRMRREHFINDWVPPRLWGIARRLFNRPT